MKNASRDSDKAHEISTQILLRLDAIEKQQYEVMADLRKYLKECVEDTVQRLSKYFLSEEVKDRFTLWAFTEIPKDRFHVGQVLSGRFREMIEEWEEENKVFANGHRDLLQYFQQRNNFVEEQLRKLQATTTSDSHVKLVHPENAWFWDLLGFIMTPLIPIALPGTSFGYTFNQLCKRPEMEKLALDFLLTATSEDKLRLMVQQQFKHAELCLKQIESRILELIQSYKMLYKELIDETRTQKEIQNLYRPIMDQGSEFRGKLMEFGIKEVCAADVSAEELVWKEDYDSQLGSGAFGAVYQGTMSRNGNIKTVALKVCRDLLDASNACSLMEEVQTLR